MSVGRRRKAGASPYAAARLARHDLARLARPARAFDASRYFRGSGALGFYNVGADRVRAMAKAIVRDHPAWTVDDAVRFADVLIRNRYLEAKGVGIEVVARYRTAFTRQLLPVWKRWLASGHAANWATTDSICGALIGPLLVAYPRLVPQVAPWSRHRSLWVRRASAVGLIPLARKGDALEAVYAVARVLHPDPADLIHKAVGWMLREAGKADAGRLERYLRANGSRIPRTTVRYAIERFPTAKRRALLNATRQMLRRRITQPLRHPSAKILVTARGIPDVRD